MSTGMGGNPANQPRQPEEPQPVKPTVLQWVPKFAGDKGMKARDPRLPMQDPPTEGAFSGNYPATVTNEWEYNTSTSTPKQYRYIRRSDRVYKVDPATNQIIWSRWSV